MKTPACFIMVWALMAHCAQAQPAPTGESGFQLTIELRDGSRLVGKSLEDTLSFHSAALGDLKLTWAGIRSIEYAGTNTAMARLTATNGDEFTIQFAGEALRVETGFGKTELPLKLIRSVKVAPSAAAGTDTARLTIELRDGSQVVGKGLDETLGFHSPAMGDLKLTWAGIRSIEYEATNADMARLTATNGDVYEVQFAAPSVRVETSFGKSELPVKLIRSVKVSAAGIALSPFLSCFGDDTNVIAMSDWSDKVEFNDCAVRGRLLIMEGYEPAYGGPRTGKQNMMFVELQNVTGAAGGSVKVYLDVNNLHLDLLDANGDHVQRPLGHSGGGVPSSGGSGWVVLPYNSTIRLFVEHGGLSPLTIYENGVFNSPWTISDSDTNVYYLSGTLTISPPINGTLQVSPHDSWGVHSYADWSGKLIFPKARILANKQ
jgi:hypothetical protein